MKNRSIDLSNKPVLRVFEAFAGIGSQHMALRNIGANFDVVGISEIDKYAIRSYNAIHGDTPNYGDISKINAIDLPDMDLLTYSFPCQDLSTAGRQKGINEHTRSGLLYECQKIIETKKPKFLLLENVKNLVGKKFKTDFDRWLVYLDSLGYTNYWSVLNAKNYGVPQNRERVFVVSILDGQPFEFKGQRPLKKTIKDILQDDVDAKYILSEKIQQRFKQSYEDNGSHNIIGTTKPSFRSIGQRDNVFGINSIMGALTATDYKQPKQIKIELPCICASRGRNKENPSDRTPGIQLEQRIELNCKGTSNTLTSVQKDNYVLQKDYKIRKLTPLECWRLMGFSDADFEKCRSINSDTQLYKQAGNSIVVPVLESIFLEMLKEWE